MTKEVGTLAELNVKPGDVVEFVEGYDGMYPEYGGKRMVGDSDGGVSFDTGNGFCGDALHIFLIVSRASEKPKLWRNMTPEEKGALLLAMHDGKKVEIYSDGEWRAKKFMAFAGDYAYRIKPEPKVETVTMDGNDIRFSGFLKCHRVTFNLIDGEPDCNSIKMEKL